MTDSTLPTVQKWEYTIEHFANLDFSRVRKMNGFGNEGWEAFGAQDNAGGLTVFFKRPLCASD